jgi:ubiquinone/menaquinone biosynthesis C-methylase UbiE
MQKPRYLDYTFNDTTDFTDVFDELPLWSAAFGMLLLKHLDLKPNLTVLDIGSGAGFPLLELAERLGESSKCYGIDPWTNANARARKKARQYGINNIEIIDGSAEKIPFENNSIDLIVSNLGINNFENPTTVLLECHRVLKSNGSIALTTNLDGHWKEFYGIFEQTLIEQKREDVLEDLYAHCAHRGTRHSTSQLFVEHNFLVSACHEDTFEMKFADGSSFLNHHFVKLGWLSSWKTLVPEKQQEFFTLLENNLNTYASSNNGLTLSVPMLYISAKPV